MNVRKHTQNVVIDLISFTGMLLLLFTGTIMHFVLPPGNHGNDFWGFTRHEWGEFHFWVALIFSGIIVYHLLLHIPWIKGSYFSLFKRGNQGKAR